MNLMDMCPFSTCPTMEFLEKRGNLVGIVCNVGGKKGFIF